MLRFPYFALLASLVTALLGCQRNARELNEIQASGKIFVLTRNSPISYFEDRDGKMVGFEHDLAARFAQSLGLTPVFIDASSTQQILRDLAQGQADMAAAGLTVTDRRSADLDFSTAYLEVDQEVICHKSHRPQSAAELSDYSLLVAQASSYEETLQNLQKRRKQQNLKEEGQERFWTTTDSLTNYEIFEKVGQEKVDCTVADSHLIKIYQRYFPQLRSRFSLRKKQKIAWAFPAGSALRDEANAWFEKKGTQSLINVLKERYHGQAKEFDPFDIGKFKERIKERLPPYKAELKKAAQLLGWDWRLLAAIAYQESHWDPQATSATGVRGFMMLTRNTANSVGVKNRLDPSQSIQGGARYLQRLSKRLPGFITGENRRWMTLAAYNVGYAHLRDAWGVAAWREKNPALWVNVREVLPLLANKSIYQRLPHGYARGMEPVLYIDRIKNYYDLLKQEL